MIYPDGEIIYGVCHVAACWIELTEILCGRMNERNDYNGCGIKQWMNLTLWLKFGNINIRITDLKHAFKYICGTQLIVKL